MQQPIKIISCRRTASATITGREAGLLKRMGYALIEYKSKKIFLQRIKTPR